MVISTPSGSAVPAVTRIISRGVAGPHGLQELHPCPDTVGTTLVFHASLPSCGERECVLCIANHLVRIRLVTEMIRYRPADDSESSSLGPQHSTHLKVAPRRLPARPRSDSGAPVSDSETEPLSATEPQPKPNRNFKRTAGRSGGEALATCLVDHAGFLTPPFTLLFSHTLSCNALPKLTRGSDNLVGGACRLARPVAIVVYLNK